MLPRKALALDPATTSAYRLLAIINMYKQRHDLALGQIDRAHALTSQTYAKLTISSAVTTKRLRPVTAPSRAAPDAASR